MSPYPSPSDPAFARVSAQVEGIGREIREMRRGFDRRLAAIEHQTKITNGNVTDLRTWRASVEAAAAERAKHEAAETTDERTADGRRWELRMVAYSALASILGGVTVAVLVFLLLPT